MIDAIQHRNTQWRILFFFAVRQIIQREAKYTKNDWRPFFYVRRNFDWFIIITNGLSTCVQGAKRLTPSTPAVPNCCCSKGSAPYWSNPRKGLSARAPECQKLKIVGLTSMAKCKALTWSAVKGLSQDWDHYLPHTSEYLTHTCHDSWEAWGSCLLLLR